MRMRPDFIVETGTAYGGSALFLATVCDAIDHRVVGIRRPKWSGGDLMYAKPPVAWIMLERPGGGDERLCLAHDRSAAPLRQPDKSRPPETASACRAASGPSQRRHQGGCFAGGRSTGGASGRYTCPSIPVKFGNRL